MLMQRFVGAGLRPALVVRAPSPASDDSGRDVSGGRGAHTTFFSQLLRAAPKTGVVKKAAFN